MKQSKRIAFRNVGRQKKRTFLLGGAIAFGFFIISLIGGLTQGLVSTVQENFTHVFGGHVYITGSRITESGRELNLIGDREVLDQLLEEFAPQIQSVNVRSRARGDLVFGSKVYKLGVLGIDFAAEPAFVQRLEVAQGSLEELGQPGTILLPQDVMVKLGMEIGESVLFQAQTVTGQRNVVELRVIASITNQEGLGSSSAYLSKDTLNEFLAMGPLEFQTMNILLRAVKNLEETSETLYARLDELAVTELDFSDVAEGEVEEEESLDQRRNRMMRAMGFGGSSKVEDEDRWEGTKYSLTNLNEMTKQLREIIGVVDVIGLVVFIILLLITMVGIMNSYRMVMLERTQEIGTMRAMGVHRASIAGIFLWEAFYISLGGALAGLILAWLTALGISLVSFGNAPGFSLFLNQGSLAFAFHPAQILRDMTLVVLLSLTAVSLPARGAARLNPADALRAQY